MPDREQFFDVVDRILAAAPDAEETQRLLATLDPQQRSEVEEVLELRGSLQLDGGSGSAPRLDRIAHFELLVRAGGGAQGQVYRARDLRLGRDVALKLFPGADGERRVRLEREARLASSLDHTGICPVLDVGEEDGRSFIAMPWLPGDSLAALLARDAWLERRARVQLLGQVARALQFAHERGVVHRDIKPGNIQITESGAPVLLDFGLARALESEAPVTVAGALLGTPAYASPEQLTGDGRSPVDARTDIWSLGVTIFETLCGTRPFRAPTRAGLVHSILNDAPDAAALRRLPSDLRVILGMALEKDPQHRYASMADLAEDLEAWCQGRSIRARPARIHLRALRWCRRHPLPATLLAALVLATAGSALLYRDSLRSLSHARAARWLAEARAVRQSSPGLAMALALRSREHAPPALLDDTVLEILEQPGERLSVRVPRREDGKERILCFALWNPTAERILAVTEDAWRGIWSRASGTWESQPKPGAAPSLLTPLGDGSGYLSVANSGEVVHHRWLDSGQLAPETRLFRSPERIAMLAAESAERVAILGESGTLLLWERGMSLRSLETGLTGVRSLAMDAGRRVAWIDASGRARVRPLTAGATLTSAGTWRGVNELAFRHDGRALAAAMQNNRIFIWCPGRMRPLDSMRVHHSGVHCVGWHPTHELLVTGSFDRDVVLTDAASRRVLARMTGHGAPIRFARFTRDGRAVLSADCEGTIKLWEVAGPHLARNLTYGFGKQLRSAWIAPDARSALLAGAAGLQVADLDGGCGRVHRVPIDGGCVAAAYAPSGKRAAGLFADGTLAVFDLPSGDIQARGRLAPRAQVAHLSWSETGDRLLLTRGSGATKLIGLEEGQLATRAELRGLPAHMTTGQVSRQGFVTGRAAFALVRETRDGTHELALHRAGDGSVLASFPLESSYVTCLDVAPDGSRVACGDGDGVLRILELETGKRTDATVGFALHSVRFGPFGRRIACAGRDGEIAIVEADDHRQVRRIVAHDSVVYDVRFDDSGTRLLSASFDGTTAMWDAADLKLRMRLEANAPQLLVQFSRDSAMFLSAGIDGQVRIRPSRPTSAMQSRFARELSPEERTLHELADER